MKKNDLQELKQKSTEELNSLIDEAKEKLFSLQLEKGQSSLKDLKSISKHRDYMAVIYTVLNLKSREVETK